MCSSSVPASRDADSESKPAKSRDAVAELIPAAIGLLEEESRVHVLLIGRGKFAKNRFAGAVGVGVLVHVVRGGQLVRTHLVETRGGDQVALAVDLPGDGGVHGADFVVTAGSRRRSRI